MKKRALDLFFVVALIVLLFGILSVYALGYFDSDGDGVRDNQDAFPYDSAASKDSDHDGHPDEWNVNWNPQTKTTNLTIDAFPYDPTEWKDSDGDGVGDNVDALPNTPTEWKDSDHDGIGDNSDAFPYDPAASKDSDHDGYPDEWNTGWTPSANKTCNISNLVSNTTYTWTVRVNDGLHWTNRSYTFTTQPAPSTQIDDMPLMFNPVPLDGSRGVPVTTSSLSIVIENPVGKLFNWTLSSSYLNAENNSGSGASNGTKTCSIFGLAYNTTYSWTVRVNDGLHWTNQTYTFITQPSPTTQASDVPLVFDPVPLDGSRGVSVNASSLNITIETPETDFFNWTITTSPDAGNSSGTGGTTNLTLDPFPHNSEEYIDSDGDGVGDNKDKFPTDPAASLDSDNDGYPDRWNKGMNQSDSTTNLTLDAFPKDPAAGKDSDYDGYPDEWNKGWTPSRTETCNISNLTYNTTFTWTVRVNDSHHWTNRSYTFTTQSAPSSQTNYLPLVFNPVPLDGSRGVPVTTSSLSIVIENPDGKYFTWTLSSSSLSLKNNSGTEASNGTKTCAISDLTYNTTYTWTVRVNDGLHWTNQTYIFTTELKPSIQANNAPLVSTPFPMNQSRGVPINTSSLSIMIENPDAEFFSWTITTSPDVGNYSGIGGTNLTLDVFPNNSNRWRNSSALPKGIISEKKIQLSEIFMGKGIAYDGSSYYYVLNYDDVNTSNRKVYQFNNNFSFTGLNWSYNLYIQVPTGIIYYGGSLYITSNIFTDRYKAYIYEFSTNGSYKTSIDLSSLSDSDNIGYAQAVTCCNHHIYVGDTKSPKYIHIYNASTLTPEGLIDNDRYPSGIVVNETGGWYYITDQSTNVNCLYLYDLQGNYKNWYTQFYKNTITLVGDRLIALSGNRIYTYKLL